MSNEELSQVSKELVGFQPANNSTKPYYSILLFLYLPPLFVFFSSFPINILLAVGKTLHLCTDPHRTPDGLFLLIFLC